MKKLILMSCSILFVFFFLSVAWFLITIRSISPRNLIRPSVDDITAKFVNGVFEKDLNSVLMLTDQTMTCQQNMSESFALLQPYMEKFRSPEYDIAMLPSQKKPNQEEISIFLREKGEEQKRILFEIITTYHWYGMRFTCGMSPDHINKKAVLSSEK